MKAIYGLMITVILLFGIVSLKAQNTSGTDFG